MISKRKLRKELVGKNFYNNIPARCRCRTDISFLFVLILNDRPISETVFKRPKNTYAVTDDDPWQVMKL